MLVLKRVPSRKPQRYNGGPAIAKVFPSVPSCDPICCAPARSTPDKSEPGYFDLDSSAHIARFVDAFYARLLQDPELAHIFLVVAQTDLNKHLPLICSYWEKLLLGNRSYQRHTMNIHRQVHEKQPFSAANFTQWLDLFSSTCDQLCRGPKTEQAKRIASNIACNMARNVTPAV